MKAKSLAVAILTALILAIGGYSGYFTAEVQAWLGIASFTLATVLTTFFKSGEMLKGWTTFIWATNIAGVLVQVLNMTSEKGLVPVEVVNSAILGVNIFVQSFLKDYTEVKKA